MLVSYRTLATLCALDAPAVLEYEPEYDCEALVYHHFNSETLPDKSKSLLKYFRNDDPRDEDGHADCAPILAAVEASGEGSATRHPPTRAVNILLCESMAYCRAQTLLRWGGSVGGMGADSKRRPDAARRLYR